MSYYSAVKLTENNTKKIMSVPSKWVMGEMCYFPKNKYMELKFANQNVDPKEDWKEIPIEKELLRNRKYFKCKIQRQVQKNLLKEDLLNVSAIKI